MTDVHQQISEYQNEIIAFDATDAEALEAFRIKFLGTKGIVKALMGEMKNIAPEERKAFGQTMNAFKQLAEDKYQALKESTGNGVTKMHAEDFTMPGEPVPVGTHHPLSLVRRQIVDIFRRIGFAVAEGPEIEDDWHNFGALNLPEDHPARDMQDTFYISTNPAVMLRTHTSNVQIRAMEKGKLPIRLIMPGRVYRNETISARAHCFFHQVE